jgi:adenylate cyclase
LKENSLSTLTSLRHLLLLKIILPRATSTAIRRETVRIRIKGESGFLTIKGKGNESGLSRFEWETEIPLMEARHLIQLCEKGVIDKIRYEVRSGNHVFEVDEFFGDNEGLVIAEVELKSEDETFEKPDWLGSEVTNDERYYNAFLSQHPYKTWK